VSPVQQQGDQATPEPPMGSRDQHDHAVTRPLITSTTIASW
jgi:hypothetical protein